MIASALLLAAAVQPQVAPGIKACRTLESQPVARPTAPPRAQKLTELPPADLHLTVLRTEDGCMTPVIVRYGIGAQRR